MGSTNYVDEEAPSSEGSFASTVAGQCCGAKHDLENQLSVELGDVTSATEKPEGDISPSENYVTSKNVAEGFMDIALLSANANQLRFLITYNDTASTFYYSLVLVILSLVLQVLVGVLLILKRRLKRCKSRRYTITSEVLIVFITVINVLLAAFTTTNGQK